jgi:hypothetical protein
VPGDAMARVNVGWTRMAMGQWAAAAEDLRAAALDPRSYFVAVIVADRMTLLRRFDEAEAACTPARALSPGDVRAPALCALIPFWRDGDTRPARAALDTVVQRWAVSNTAVASGVDLLNVWPQAVLELSWAGKLPDPISQAEPFLPRALMLGIAHQELGHETAARVALAQALEAPAGPLTPASARADPGLASLHGYPPFEALVAQRLAGR